MKKQKKNYTPKDLYEILGRTVIGQDEYKRKLCNAVWLHSKRIEAMESMDHAGRTGDFKKYNLFCVGPTGSGKTLAVTTLAKIYGFDVGIFNGPDFTGAGWQGRDPIELVKEMYRICGNSKERTERSIVIIDETDKMLVQRNYRKNDSFNAENSFLKIIEGMQVEVNNKVIDTSGILFICAGAFEGIEDIVRKRMDLTRSIGFGSHADKEDIELYQLITKEDIREYGAGMQFLGRFSSLAHLNPLTKEEMKRILLESDSSVVADLDKLLYHAANMTLTIDDAGADAIAEKAMKENTGARGLSQILMDELEDVIFSMEPEDDMEGDILLTAVDGKPIVKVHRKKVVKETIRKPEAVPFRCRDSRYAVEALADYILSASDEIKQCNIRELRACHQLFCSIIFFLLRKCDPEEQTTNEVKNF